MSLTQLRIGMIGISGRGGLWRHWHDPQGRSVVIAAADIAPEHLEAFRHEHGDNPFTTLDYRELLARPDIDAIAVTSPDYCHEEQAVAALEAGKHVFCEKPLAITIEGCDRILQAWRKSSTGLMVGFNMRYMNIFRVMKEIIESGAIGEVKAAWVRHFVGLSRLARVAQEHDLAPAAERLARSGHDPLAHRPLYAAHGRVRRARLLRRG